MGLRDWETKGFGDVFFSIFLEMMFVGFFSFFLAVCFFLLFCLSMNETWGACLLKEREMWMLWERRIKKVAFCSGWFQRWGAFNGGEVCIWRSKLAKSPGNYKTILSLSLSRLGQPVFFFFIKSCQCYPRIHVDANEFCFKSNTLWALPWMGILSKIHID